MEKCKNLVVVYKIFKKPSTPKLLNRILRCSILISLKIYIIKVCSSSGAFCILREIIAKENLNIKNSTQTLKNLILQNYPTEFWDNVRDIP